MRGGVDTSKKTRVLREGVSIQTGELVTRETKPSRKGGRRDIKNLGGFTATKNRTLGKEKEKKPHSGCDLVGQ